MRAKTLGDIQKSYDAVNAAKRLSDGLVKLGPINIIGLDGILAWIPLAGPIYSIGASLFMLYHGIRARIDIVTLAQILIFLFIDSGLGIAEDIPFIGEVMAGANTLFQGHLYAGHVIEKDIERTLYLEQSATEAYRTCTHQANLALMKATKGKKRLVYLLA